MKPAGERGKQFRGQHGKLADFWHHDSIILHLFVLQLSTLKATFSRQEALPASAATNCCRYSCLGLQLASIACCQGGTCRMPKAEHSPQEPYFCAMSSVTKRCQCVCCSSTM